MLEIRRPRIDEIAALQIFFYNLLRKNFPMFNQESFSAYERNWQLDKLKSRILNDAELLFIACEDNKLIGLISGTPPEGGVGTIIWLIVDECARGRNIGKDLLSEARKHYLRLHAHKIKLTAPSITAKDFYLKQGMTLEGFHKSHWYKIDFWALGQELLT